jgi:NTP pyrophosphatase (non-canonical NTP hydrolase)
MNGLMFRVLREANMRRVLQFRNSKGELTHSQLNGSDWSPAEWLQAVVGELGELANVMKKVKRGDFALNEVLPDIKKEMADVIIYFDILAAQYGIDLGEVVSDKFNEVSRRVDARVFIGSANDCNEVGAWDPRTSYGVDY